MYKNQKAIGLLGLSAVLIVCLLITGCTRFIYWRGSYEGATLKQEALSLRFDKAALKCRFGLWNAWHEPTAIVELKNLSDDVIEYDFSRASIVCGDSSSVPIPSSDHAGVLGSDKRVKIEIEFEKMVGNERFVRIDGREGYVRQPIKVRLGQIICDGDTIVLPDLEFSNRHWREFL